MVQNKFETLILSNFVRFLKNMSKSTLMALREMKRAYTGMKGWGRRIERERERQKKKERSLVWYRQLKTNITLNKK